MVAEAGFIRKDHELQPSSLLEVGGMDSVVVGILVSLMGNERWNRGKVERRR